MVDADLISLSSASTTPTHGWLAGFIRNCGSLLKKISWAWTTALLEDPIGLYATRQTSSYHKLLNADVLSYKHSEGNMENHPGVKSTPKGTERCRLRWDGGSLSPREWRTLGGTWELLRTEHRKCVLKVKCRFQAASWLSLVKYGSGWEFRGVQERQREPGEKWHVRHAHTDPRFEPVRIRRFFCLI